MKVWKLSIMGIGRWPDCFSALQIKRLKLIAKMDVVDDVAMNGLLCFNANIVSRSKSLLYSFANER